MGNIVSTGKVQKRRYTFKVILDHKASEDQLGLPGSLYEKEEERKEEGRRRKNKGRGGGVGGG